ncbi:hypothetical protein Bca4012_085519 [Brassica carinata]
MLLHGTVCSLSESCSAIHHPLCSKRKQKKMPRIDRISALHDDLLLNILSLVPTNDAVTTMVLSKRWGSVWTMVPKLEYEDTSKEGGTSVWRLVDKSLQLHKAHVLESLHIQAERQFTDNADVGKCVSYAVDHNVRELSLIIIPPLIFPIQPEFLLLPSNFYTSKTLANCPVLSYLRVNRNSWDNVKIFTVKVPSLKSFTYADVHKRYSAMSLVLDSPGLGHLSICNHGDIGSIQNMPHLETACVGQMVPEPNDELLRSFSSVRILHLRLMDVACFSAINFPRLMEFKLHLYKPHSSEFIPGYSEECSLEPVMFFLHNSPILKELTISYDVGPYFEDLPLSWNQQSSVPGCLLSHLEIFVWDKFGGRRRQERECVEYILANSKCLKTATVLPRCSYRLEEKEKMVEDIKSMYRVSASSQLIAHSDSTNPGWATIKK